MRACQHGEEGLGVSAAEIKTEDRQMSLFIGSLICSLPAVLIDFSGLLEWRKLPDAFLPPTGLRRVCGISVKWEELR